MDDHIMNQAKGRVVLILAIGAVWILQTALALDASGLSVSQVPGVATMSFCAPFDSDNIVCVQSASSLIRYFYESNLSLLIALL
jgi:hypothetical protein